MPDRDSFDEERTRQWYARFDVPAEEAKPSHSLRGQPGEPVPADGLWWTPALPGEAGRRHFTQGQRFPEMQQTDYGAVIWYRSEH